MAITRKASIELHTAIPGPYSQAVWERMTHAVPGALSPGLPIVADKASGSIITDVDGNRFIDLTGGLGVLNVGHCHPGVVKAITRQVSQLLHTSFGSLPYENYVRLAERLTALYPGGGPARAMFFNSGSEAVENAVKIAQAVTGRKAVVAFERAFHGRTYMALSLTGKTRPYKTGLGALAPEVYRIPYAYSYRCRFGPEIGHVCNASCYQRIEETIQLMVDPASIAAVIVEPVLGEGGFVVPPPDFLPWLRDWTRRHGILLAADEIQTGFGRTGRYFAVEHSQIRPDLLIAGKSIAGGLPLSVVLGDGDLLQSLLPGQLGGTYGGNPVAIAAAEAVLDIIDHENLLWQAQRQGEYMTRRLQELVSTIPQIGEVRGLGAMVGVEFVTDRTRRLPHGAFVKRTIQEALKHGVLLAKAGTQGHIIRFLAPLNTPSEVLKEALDVTQDAIAVVSASSP